MKIADLVDGERDRASTGVEMMAADGTRRQYDASLAVICEDGGFEGTVVTAHDVTDLREHTRKLSVLDRVPRRNVRNKTSVVLGHASDIAERADAVVIRVAGDGPGLSDTDRRALLGGRSRRSSTLRGSGCGWSGGPPRSPTARSTSRRTTPGGTVATVRLPTARGAG